MIGGIFSKYIINKMAENQTPIVKKNRCINKLQRRQPCDKCINCCPKKAISNNSGIEIDDKLCQNCNICTTVCPTGTTVPRLEVVEGQYNIITKLDDVSIGCETKGEIADYTLKCIASLPWEFLAYITLENKLTISLSKCKECDNTEAYQEILINLNKLKNFIGEEKYNNNVILIEESDKIPVKEVSRRELLKIFGEESKRFMTTIMPIDFEKNDNGRIYRSILIQKINELEKQNNKVENYGWCGLSVNNNCYGCGICEKLCPNSAIEIRITEEGQRQFIHKYRKCTHCKLCQTVCMEKAITTVKKLSSDMKHVDKFNISSLSCKVCGDAIQEDDNGICAICKN
ncbi:MAG: 4Fe-4S dicluster domain-containing protein [Clostridium sp.]